ncbi:hypothetical protein K8352_09525 [Flavobacteriaceae bacterium F89]|uniref:Uncharacterized protein n=1 Tax=Cerina litoralis TaxID=2874477 RepID=A0AAE3EWK4_9FLAO|nr:hypothetical protein [Cerina litoralis]MCG2460986.1 hypothetical protein [Cerina litoralis]
MKKLFQQITSFCLALLVLFSTMSFTVDMHFCGKSLVDVSILKKAATCGMEMKEDRNHKEDVLEKKSCCSDHTITVAGQDNIKASFEKLSFGQQLFVAAFTYSYLNLYGSLATQIVPFRDYTPPLLVRDVLRLDQTFLI